MDFMRTIASNRLDRRAGSLPRGAATVRFARRGRRRPIPEPKEDSSFQQLLDAANAVVTVKMKALADARTNAYLGEERTGSGVVIAPSGLVLTIGYLVLEADSVDHRHEHGAHDSRDRGRLRPRDRFRVAAPHRLARREADPPRHLEGHRASSID